MSGLTGNEFFLVVGRDGRGRPSGEAFQTTTANVAALAGGAGSGPVTTIASGVSYVTSIADTFVSWNTVTTGNKITHVTTLGMNDGQVLVVKDYTAGNYSQTIQAVEPGVTIEYASSYVFDPANGASVNLKWDAENNNLIVW